MDFEHLETTILVMGIENHHNLVKHVNRDWAQPLGFSLKMKRAPKENKAGHKTLRLYCSVARSNTTKSDINHIEESTGLKEECCFFALSFRYVADSQTWILHDEFDTSKMWHTHPFFHSYTLPSDCNQSSLSSSNTASKKGSPNGQP